MINNLEEYHIHYRDSVKDPEKYWKDYSSKFLWKKEPSDVLNWNFIDPDIKWFKDGELNITENIFERNKEKADDIAIIWEPNEPNEENITYTYNQLFDEVCSFANVLKKLGVEKGDRVIIYLPMIPEAAISMLACARIGAVHSVVFAGFSASSLSDRINDCQAKLVITSDGNFRGNKIIPVKDVVDEAIESTSSIDYVLTIRRTSSTINMKKDRDIWYHEIVNTVDKSCEAEKMKSEDLLFILYTSGSTGKPKGVVHTCAGYMLYTQFTFENVFQYKDGDTYWCTADVGWITGHSYILYGPLSNGATTLMFEGVPSYPDFSRFWQIVDKYKVNQFYTAPTAIRALAKQGDDFLKDASLKSIKVLGTVGEPINQEAWEWYDNNIGKNKCPIVDTWWQTETGGILISSIPNVIPDKPTFATKPFIGIQPILIDDSGDELNEANIVGKLCVKYPWPSIARTIWGNHERYINTYFSAYDNMYFTGDGAFKDDEGNFRITGRVDDVIIVSGHNLGTAPIEDAINEHKKVAESAIVGFPHDIKGNALYGFVTLKDEINDEKLIRKEINNLISNKIGPIAKLDKIQFASGLPKTRSGKIMRRILRKIASKQYDDLGDISTLLNPEIVQEIKDNSI